MATEDRDWGALARVVRERRKDMRLNQADLERHGGPGEYTVRDVERAVRSNFSARTLRSLEAALHFPSGALDDVLDGALEKDSPELSTYTHQVSARGAAATGGAAWGGAAYGGAAYGGAVSRGPAPSPPFTYEDYLAAPSEDESGPPTSTLEDFYNQPTEQEDEAYGRGYDDAADQVAAEQALEGIKEARRRAERAAARPFTYTVPDEQAAERLRGRGFSASTGDTLSVMRFATAKEIESAIYQTDLRRAIDSLRDASAALAAADVPIATQRAIARLIVEARETAEALLAGAATPNDDLEVDGVHMIAESVGDPESDSRVG